MHYLSIIGAGIDDLNQLTISSLQELKNAERIMCLGGDYKTLLEQLNFTEDKIVSLDYCYEDGGKDVHNYQRLYEKIISETLCHTTNCLVVGGHPRLGVTLTGMLESSCDPAQVAITTWPGISSFDALINEIKLDPIESGTCLLDANRILLFEYDINPLLDVFIYHVCSVGTTNTNYLDHTKDNHLYLLKKHLLKYYKDSHEFYLISSSGKHHPTQSVKDTLTNLERRVANANYRTSMYIPASLPESYNSAYLDLLQGYHQ